MARVDRNRAPLYHWCEPKGAEAECSRRHLSAYKTEMLCPLGKAHLETGRVKG